MEEIYIKSIQFIKKYKVTKVKEYNKMVKKYNLLNSITLKYMSGKSFSKLIKMYAVK